MTRLIVGPFPSAGEQRKPPVAKAGAEKHKAATAAAMAIFMARG
jgi:hypothetical protein